MVYKNMAEVLIGVYGKLQKKRDNLQTKKSELGFRLVIIKDNPDLFSVEKEVEKELDATEFKLNELNKELTLFENKINGGASLDRFILSDEVLKKVENKLNKDSDDVKVEINRVI